MSTATTDHRPEDVQQAEKIAGAPPVRVVPPALARLGYIELAIPGFNISDEFYIYKPLAAWDAAQVEVDNLIRVTGGHIYTLVEDMRNAIKGASEMDLEEGEDDSVRIAVFGQMALGKWQDFLLACPNFNQVEWATRMIKRCEVRRIAKPEHHGKSDDDATKDFGGLIFEVTGTGHVDRYYKGRRAHVVRVGLAAGWGSFGDFFVER